MADNRTNKKDNEKSFKYRRMRKKVNPVLKDPAFELDYKDVDAIQQFINEKGKILPRRVTGANAKQQREITRAVKRARQAGIIAYEND